MYCYKCGQGNAIEAKFCRVCGSELPALIAAGDHRSEAIVGLTEKYAEVYAKGVRGVLASIGFLIVTAAAFAARTPEGYLWLLFMPFFFVYLATGISRLVQARTLRQMHPRAAANVQHREITAHTPGSLPSKYDTDNLIRTPFSVTEHTTTQLQLDDADQEQLRKT